MIKLKDILLENTAPNIFVPRRVEDRFERMIGTYIRNGNKGDLILRQKNLNKLPSILKNINIDGNFDCGNNKLTTLENSPKNVSGHFICNNSNLLTSLVGAPSSVGGDFWCDYCKLTTLEGAPKFVGESFMCYNNELTSLTGAPKSVGGNFYCSDNPVKFTETQVRAVCDVKGRVYV
jgi:hypothetical protein